MMAIFGPLLAAALMAQFQGRTLQGTVVDDQGKPVADAQVIFHASAPWKGDAEPVEVRAKTDAEGRFRLTTSRMAGVSILDSKVWAYRPGSAITAVPCRRQPLALVLRKPEPRMRQDRGAWRSTGRQGAGSPHELSSSLVREPGTCPTRWPRRGGHDRAGRHGDAQLPGGQRPTDGRAHHRRVARHARLAHHRRDPPQRPAGPITISSDRRAGWPDVSELERGNPSRPGFRSSRGCSWTRIQSGSRTGQSVRLLIVRSRPLTTSSSAGPYRVIGALPGERAHPVGLDHDRGEAEGLAPHAAETVGTPSSGRSWIGRASRWPASRSSKSGNGQERTSTKTDAAGRFTLGGFSQGPVFVFARGEGFRILWTIDQARRWGHHGRPDTHH